jgi:DNA-binding NarL/FixJ family response regulator
MTPDELRKAEHRYKLAVLKSESAREERNRLVREALAEGWTHAQIAEATGLTRGRVGQIR